MFESNIFPFQNHIIFKIDFNIIFKLLLTFKLEDKKELERFQGCRFTWDVVAGVLQHMEG